MQRLLKLFSPMVLLALVLAACGSGTSTTTGPGAATSPPAAADATAAPAAAAGATAEPTAAVSSLGNGGTKIVLWHKWRPEYLKSVQKLFGDYATKNNVTIEMVEQADLQNKIGVAVPSGQGPDIIAWVDDIIGKNALSGIIQPLDQYGADKAYITQNFTPIAAEGATYKDKIYGVPESMEAISFVYNKKLIKDTDIPKDTDALIAKAKEYNAANAGQYFFVYNAKNDAYFAAPWWQGSGVQLVTNDGKTELGTDKGVAAGNLIKSFTEVMPKELDYSVADTLFKEGKAAIIMNGPWAIPDYQAAGLDVGVATIPVVSNSGQPGKPYVGVKMLMLSAKAKSAQAAVDLMKYYGSTEVQGELAKVNKLVPANIKAQDEVKSDPIVAGFISQAANGVALPNTEFADAMWDPVGKTVEAIWTGSSAPDQAVKDGAALFEEKVQDLR